MGRDAGGKRTNGSPRQSDKSAIDRCAISPKTLGRKYEDAVKAFQPYNKTQEINEDARKAGAALLMEGERYEPRRKTFIYINNRLEGNALATIEAMLAELGSDKC